MHANTLTLFLLLSLAVPKESLRFEYIHEQGFDTSCGFSAAAGLMNIYWNVDVTEKDLIQLFLESRTNGNYTSSLADLSVMLNTYDIPNQSYRMSVEQLAKSLSNYSPALVHYDDPTNHFALVLSVNAGTVVTADPARGLETLSVAEFEERWSGVALLSASKDKQKATNKIVEAVQLADDKQRFLNRLCW